MLKLTGAVVALTSLMPLGVVARQMPGRHPGYVHAVQDLRYARALLDRGDRGWGPVAADQQHATAEIDRAIEELRRAAMDHGRSPNERPRVDMRWEPRDRLHRASEALGHARESISREEENPGARAMRDRAFHHIEEAQRALHHAMDKWR